MSKAKAYECDGCGLCCRSLIVEADALDVLREPAINERCNQPIKGRLALSVFEVCWHLYDPQTKACPFLGESNRCGIYPTRPNTCVGFQAGGRKCQELRADHGLAPLLPKRAVTVVAQIGAALIEDDTEE
jgi:Fe-S-cluster containining protein